jgi:hypothetical protein
MSGAFQTDAYRFSNRCLSLFQPMPGAFLTRCLADRLQPKSKTPPCASGLPADQRKLLQNAEEIIDVNVMVDPNYKVVTNKKL